MRYFTLLFAMILTSCSTPTGLYNLHEVESDFYRGGQPDADGYRMLRLKGIKTVIKLNTENLEEERALAVANGIDLYYMPLSGVTAPDTDTELDVQMMLLSEHLRPIYIHCMWGKDRTGLAVALYRVNVQKWDPDRAHSEWRELGHSPLLFLMDRYFYNHVK